MDKQKSISNTVVLKMPSEDGWQVTTPTSEKGSVHHFMLLAQLVMGHLL